MSSIEPARLNIARMKHARTIVTTCLCGWLMSGAVHVQAGPDGGDAPAFKTSREISPKVRKEYCGERPFYGVKVLKDAEGNIGGYVLQPAIRDAPIPFLDHEGTMLTSFHIFAPDEEKRVAMAIVTPLTARFPLQERLNCEPGAAAR